MRSLAAAILAAVVAATSLTPSAAALVPPPLAAQAVGMALDDASDAVPYVEDVRAALIALGAPTINELDVLDSTPLADRFDDAARYVAVPSGGLNELTMIVGAYNVEEGTDERAEFQSAYAAVQAFAQRRGGLGGFQATALENGFGASEAFDAVLISQEGGADKNLMVVRLARFGKTIVFTSTDTDLKTSPVSDAAKEGAATINVILSKLVADKAR